MEHALKFLTLLSNDWIGENFALISTSLDNLKGFKSLDHDILVHRLDTNFQIRGNVLDVLHSYQSNYKKL